MDSSPAPYSGRNLSTFRRLAGIEINHSRRGVEKTACVNVKSSFAEAIGHLELRQLRYIIAVSEAGSISAAARSLKIAQSAVSRSIHMLEESLGVKLFERHARGVATTPYGTALVHHCRLIEASLRHAADDLGALRGSPQAQVRVGLGPVEAGAIMAEALMRFKRRHPQTKVIVREGFYAMLEPGLLSGDLDLIVGGGGRSREDVSTAQLRAERVGSVYPAVVVRRTHPLAKKRRVTKRDLIKYEWILPHLGAPQLAFFAPFLREHLNPPRGFIHASTTSWTSLELVLRNDIIALLPRQLIQHGVATGALKVLDLGDDFYSFPTFLVTREESPLTGEAASLLAEIRTVCRELKGIMR